MLVAIYLVPVCVLGRVVIEPARMNRVIVNIADDATKKLVTKMPPNKDGTFMMFLDPGVYRMRLVGLRGQPIGPLKTLKVEKGEPARACVPSTYVKPDMGRLEGWLNVFPLTPTQKIGQTAVPPVGLFKGCTVSITGADGTIKKISAATYGIFTADLKPGDYTVTTDFKTPSPREPFKVTIKAGSLSTARIEVDSGIR